MNTNEITRPTKIKTAKVRRYEWDENSTVQVHLVPVENNDTEWDVHYQGHHIGRIGSYTGVLDRQVGRFRTSGKQRKLWHTQTTRSRNANLAPIYGRTSRADALRRLLLADEKGL